MLSKERVAKFNPSPHALFLFSPGDALAYDNS
jgi:hypothetical protein